MQMAQLTYTTQSIPILNHFLTGELKRASWLQIIYSGKINDTTTYVKKTLSG